MKSAARSSDRLDELEREPLPGGLELRHARTAGERRRGLAGLAALPPGVALRIHRCRSIHTVGMRFDLDLVWLDGEGAVVRVDLAVPARRARTCLRARSVVEANAGEGDQFVATLARPSCG